MTTNFNLLNAAQNEARTSELAEKRVVRKPRNCSSAISTGSWPPSPLNRLENKADMNIDQIMYLIVYYGGPIYSPLTVYAALNSPTSVTEKYKSTSKFWSILYIEPTWQDFLSWKRGKLSRVARKIFLWGERVARIMIETDKGRKFDGMYTRTVLNNVGDMIFNISGTFDDGENVDLTWTFNLDCSDDPLRRPHILSGILGEREILWADPVDSEIEHPDYDAWQFFWGLKCSHDALESVFASW